MYILFGILAVVFLAAAIVSYLRNGYSSAKVIVFAALFALFLILTPVNFNSYPEETIKAVYLKDIVDEGRTLISVQLENGKKEILANNDDFLYGKTNSSDFYNLFDEPGRLYQITVVGHRWSLVSAYRNIIAVEPIE